MSSPTLPGAAAAAAATVLLAAATRTRGVQHADDALEAFAGRHRIRTMPFARIGTLPGERWVHPSIGAATAILLLLRRPATAAAATLVTVGAASLGAILAHHAIKLVYPRRRPAGALARGKTEAAYPSGHTADATAVLLTCAWLLVHARIMPPALALAIAITLATVTGLSRVALGWHWGTDVLGGWLSGLAVAAGCVALYGGLT
jgi:membrane-associated phospholipid phosphatase